MQINVSFDSSVTNAPTGFVAAVNYVVNYFDTLFTNNVTINLNVGYGEVAGQTLASGALGESVSSSYVAESYSSVVGTLQAQGAPGASALPSTSPVPGALYMTPAEAQALGLTNAVSTGYVGFSSSAAFDFAANTTPTSSQYYFVGVAEHEISEILGRVSLINDQPNYYDPMDLYRYSAAGVHSLAPGGSGSTVYFSINNGVTNLGTWNNQTSNGDLGDWYPSGPAAGGNDAFNDYTSPGVINVVSANDITLMQALGWTTQASGGIAVTATTTAAIQGGAPVSLLPSSPVITDSASTMLAGATIKITNASGSTVAGDQLYVNGIQSGSLGNGVTASWNASTGTLTLSGSQTIAVYEALLGSVSYQDTGTDSSSGSQPVRDLTWTVNDGTNSYSTISQLTIDRAPVANNTATSDVAGSTVTATAAAGVLANATDPDGDKLTVSGVSDATSGTWAVGSKLAGAYGHLTLNADGSYSYVADNSAAISSAPTGSHLQDSFTYTVSDGDGGTATATLTITLDRAPIANNTATSDVAGSTVTATAAAGVLASASDADGDKLTVSGVSDATSGTGAVGNKLAGAYGHLTLNADGSYSYVADNSTAISSAPTGSHLQDVFTYTVSDGAGGTATATLTITLDRAPIANNTATSDVAGSTVTATAAAGVLASASDPDGDKLTVSGVSDATSGTAAVGSKLAGAYGHLTLNADGSYSYVADNSAAISSAPTGSHLQDSFTYTVSDGDGGTATATLTIILDRAPVANNTATSDVAGSTVTATAAAGVLASASDPDGDKLTVSGVSDATSGTGAVGSKLAGAYGHLTLNADGSYSYVADNSAAISSAPTGSHLQDSFTYTVSDGDGGTATATLTITLDRAPFVQVANVALAGAQTSAAASSLLNASDPDGDAITTYAFKDSGNGHFILSGVVQANNQEIDVSAAQLAHLTYQSAGGADTVQVRVYDGTLWSGWQSFTVTGSSSVVIQTDGSTSLVQVGANYFLNPVGGGTGPELKYNGSPVYAGEFASSPIGAVQVSGGYDVAWKNASTGQFAVWNTNSNGGWLANLASAVAGNSTTLESFETIFHQDLNGDGVIGIPAVVIQTDGSTSLVQVGANYFLNPVGGGTGPELKYNGSPVYAGEFASSPIGAVQVSGGYDVAWKNASTGQFAVWNTNSNGAWLANLASAVAGNSTRLESFETIFHQDLNGDGVIGIPTVVIQTDGSTSLVQVGANYFLNPVGGGTGPELKYNGSPVYAGEFASSPIGAVQVSGGYDVAWKNASTGQFAVWNTNSNGGWLANLASAVAGNSTRLESFETIFHQDLNGDGVIGIPAVVIQTDGSTSLVQVGANYFLNPVGGGTGPELKYNGSPVYAGEFASSPIGAVQVSGGYDVAWKNASTGQFAVWNTNSNGGWLANLASAVAGNSTTLESFETIFHQDLNGDGVIGTPPATQTATIQVPNVQLGSPTFEGTTLTLDHPSTFAGQIVGFTGNGTLAGSEQIDLRGLNYNSMHFSFNNASETLTVSDGSTTAKLQFLGQYSQDNFHFAGDGSGGTMVFSSATSGQTTASAVQAGAAGQNTVAHIGEQDTFVFAPNFGHVTLAGFAPATDTIQFSKSVFADISALLAAVYNDPSGNAVITDAAHDTITIQHVTTAQLLAHQSDFHFV